MVSIIPVDIEITTTEESRHLGESQHSEEYFIDRIFRNNPENFKSAGISATTIKNIKKLVETETKAISGTLNDTLTNSSSIRALLPDYGEIEIILNSMSSQEVFTTKSEPRATILVTSAESFIIISNERSTIDSLISTLDSDLKKIGDITKDFGLSYIGLVRAEKYADYLFRNSIEGLIDYRKIDSKNDFEVEISNHIASLTDCFCPNIEIFYESPEESFEYDVLIPFAKNCMINIEVKDYTKVKEEQHMDFESLKSKLVLTPVDKATRLAADVVVVTKGFPDKIFEQLKEFAISRDVLLLNENNYKDEIQSLLIDRATNLVIRRERRRQTRSRLHMGRIPPSRYLK